MEKADSNQAPSLHLITCVVQRGKGDAIAKAAVGAGAGGATIYFARGVGTRERMGLLGLAIVPEKEVVLIVCKEDMSAQLLEVVTKAGSLDVPGMGIAYISPVLGISGHF